MDPDIISEFSAGTADIDAHNSWGLASSEEVFGIVPGWSVKLVSRNALILVGLPNLYPVRHDPSFISFRENYRA
jgi:hypothetical protein